jgi:hypothetical protein
MTVEITPRLRQLLLLLSSDQPGEVAAAAAAITRTLKSEGMDWHALVDGLTKEPRPRRSAHSANHSDETSDWRAMREYCLERCERLRDREREFLEDLGRWRGDLTEKQHSWLLAIHGRLRRTAA